MQAKLLAKEGKEGRQRRKTEKTGNTAGHKSERAVCGVSARPISRRPLFLAALADPPRIRREMNAKQFWSDFFLSLAVVLLSHPLNALIIRSGH